MVPRGWSLLGKGILLATVAAAARPATMSAQIIIGPGGQLQGHVQLRQSRQAETEGDLVQNIFRQPDRKIVQRLNNARKLLDRGRYGEAVRLLDELLENREHDGQDYFFQPDRNVPIHRSLKAEAQRLIGRMPRQGREIYELQFGAAAKRMLTEAISRGDRARLAEVSRRFFHTQAGYEATLLLGLDHLDHARPLAGALTLQRLRRSLPSAGKFEPTLSLAAATCWLQASVPDKAQEVLRELKKQQGSRAVALADKQVSLFARETEGVSWLAGRIGPQGAAGPAEPDRWVMFRGGPSRNAASTGSAPLLNLRWRIPTTDDPLAEDILRQLWQAHLEHGIPTLPGLHPLVVHKEFEIERPNREPWRIEDVVLMRTARTLLAVDLRTGKRFWEVPVDDPFEAVVRRRSPGTSTAASPQLAPALGCRMWDDATYGTLSSDGRYVFSVEDLEMGIRPSSQRRVIINGRSQVTAPKVYNRLAAHDIRTGKLEWHLGGPSDEFALPLAETFFLGPPLPLMGSLYVLAEIKEEIRLLALDAGDKGKVLWSQQLAVVDRNILMDPLRRLAGASPSYSDGILVCPTSAGAVVAVDLATRSLLWGYRYERPRTVERYTPIPFRVGVHPSSQPMQRWVDASVTIVGGRVLITPVESQELHCLNLIDGERLWKEKRQDDLYVACADREKVILVGSRQVRALRLSDGKPAWRERAVELPEGSMPSGRGFLSGGRYFVPLTTAEVVSIDLAAGKLTRVSKSRKGNVPGNLICYQGKVISQGVDGVEVFYQLDSVGKEIERLLAADAEDPLALSLRGEVLLDEGKHPEALAYLQRAHQLDPAPRTRDLLRDALLEGLRVQFSAHRDRAEEIEKLLDTPEQRAKYLRLMATGLQGAGEWQAALERYLELIDLDQKHRSMEQITESLSVRRDRWIQARLASLRVEAAGRAAIDGEIAARLEAALAAEETAPLRRFLDYFGSHPTAVRARRELFRRLKNSDQLLEAELLLWGQQQSPVRAVAGAAVAELAAMFRQAKRPQAAAWCYRRLGRDFADAVCLNGKTGKELLNELPEDGIVRQALRGYPAWPAGNVKNKVGGSPRPRTYAFGPFALQYQGSRAPFFSEMTVGFDQSRRQIQARDGLGNVRWQAPLTTAGSSSSFGNYHTATYGRVCGHLLLLTVGQKVLAVDTLGSSGADTRKVLWSQNLIDPNIEAVGLRPLGIGPGNVVLWRLGGINIGRYYSGDLRAVGPVTSHGVCFQRYRNLVVVDPLSGETLWVRGGTAPGSAMFGDDQFLFALPPDKGEAAVYRVLDGKLLGKRKIPRVKMPVVAPGGTQQTRFIPFNQSCLATLGRLLLLWRLEGGHCVLELFDPWEQRSVWPPRKFGADAKTCLLGHEALGVFERDGHFVLLALPDASGETGGRTIADLKLQPEENLSEMRIFRSGDQYVVMAICPRRRRAANAPSPQPLNGNLNQRIESGRVYSLDQSGNLLWPKPAEIHDQYLLSNQPCRLPVLTFACRIYNPQLRSGRTQVSILCLDKRSGRTVYDEELSNSTSTVEVRGDPEKKTVDLRLNQQSVTLTFTDDPIPPSEGKDAASSRPPKAARAMLRALGAAFGGSAKERTNRTTETTRKQ